MTADRVFLATLAVYLGTAAALLTTATLWLFGAPTPNGLFTILALAVVVELVVLAAAGAVMGVEEQRKQRAENTQRWRKRIYEPIDKEQV